MHKAQADSTYDRCNIGGSPERKLSVHILRVNTVTRDVVPWGLTFVSLVYWYFRTLVLITLVVVKKNSIHWRRSLIISSCECFDGPECHLFHFKSLYIMYTLFPMTSFTLSHPPLPLTPSLSYLDWTKNHSPRQMLLRSYWINQVTVNHHYYLQHIYQCKFQRLFRFRFYEIIHSLKPISVWEKNRFYVTGWISNYTFVMSSSRHLALNSSWEEVFIFYNTF